MGAEDLDKSIELLESWRKDVEEIQQLVEELEETGEVTVMNPDDSFQFTIRTTQEEVTDAMTRLSKYGLRDADIVYEPFDDEYTLEKKWRVNR